MKDIKYIIKRVIIGVLIAIILMTIKKVNAEEIGSIVNLNLHTSGYGQQFSYLYPAVDRGPDFTGIETPIGTGFENVGKGYVIFSFAYYSSGSYQTTILGVSLKSGSQLYACDIGNLEPYTDSGVQYKMASAKCYVNFGSAGLERIRYTINYMPKTTGNITINISRYATFVGSPTPQSNQDIINSITTTSQEQIRLQTQTNAKLDTQINQNNTMIQQQQQQIQQQQETNNTLKDDSPADNTEMTTALDPGNLPGGGAISNLISLPLILLNQLLSVLGFSCTDAIIPLPFVNQSFKYECVDNIFNKLGWSTQWELTGTIAGAIVLYYYLLYLYDRVNHILFLEDKGDLRKYY